VRFASLSTPAGTDFPTVAGRRVFDWGKDSAVTRLVRRFDKIAKTGFSPAPGGGLTPMHILSFLTGLWSKSAGTAGPFDHATQKLQLGRLLVVAVARASAEISLPDHPSLGPFGVTLDLDGRIQEAAGAPVPAEPLDAEAAVFELRNAAQRGIAACRILAFAVVSGMRIIPLGSFARTDAVVVDLRHRDGLAFTVYQPYQIDGDGQMTSERPFLSTGPTGARV